MVWIVVHPLEGTLRIASMRDADVVTMVGRVIDMGTGVTRPTLYDLLHKYGLSTEGYTKRTNDGNGTGEDQAKD